jgi:type IV pilus assembly protein PilC
VTSFRYQALDSRGVRLHGVTEATTASDLANLLAARGFTMLRAEEVAHGGRGWEGRVPRRELIDFTHNLATLESSGIPLYDGLHDLAEESARAPLGPVIRELEADVGRGRRLSEAMARFPRTFSPVYREVVGAGESAGSLPEVLRRLAEHLEWRESVRGLVRQMLVYPTVLALAVVGLVVFLVTFLVPRLSEVYRSAGVQLPAPTRALLLVTDLFTRHALFLVGAVILLAGGLGAAGRSEEGRVLLSRLALRLPRIGSLLRKVAAAQFASTLSTLYRAGIDLRSALETTAGVLENRAMRRAVREAARRLLSGAPLAEAVRATGAFQPLVTRMIAVGERAGRVDEAFDRIVAYYDRDVPAVVRRFLAFVEPCLTVCAGLVVGFVVLAALLPVFRLFEAVRR